jgi:hypothetical protein
MSNAELMATWMHFYSPYVFAVCMTVFVVWTTWVLVEKIFPRATRAWERYVALILYLLFIVGIVVPVALELWVNHL